jgi:hypothetical protein
MIVFAAQGRSAPVTASRAPMPMADWPLRVVKRPPATTSPLPAGATSANTDWSAVGAQPRTAPDVPSTAASRVRDRPETAVTSPPV